jgi:hypothetical protein
MGKLGIIFAFLLSVAAAAGSYYLYQGWVEERTVRGSVEAKYDQVQEKMIAVQSEREQFKAKSEEYRTKAEAMQSQMEKFQAEQKRIDSEKAALEQQLKGHQEMIAELQRKVGELEKKAKDAQAACNVSPADLKTDIYSAPKPFESGATSVVTNSAASAGDTSSQLVFKPMTSGSTALATSVSTSTSSVIPASTSSPATGIKEVSVTMTTPGQGTSAVMPAETPQGVEPVSSPADVVEASGAKVLTVNRKFNFVVINQGLQDGLKMGDKLKVLKQGQESATVQVEKLYDKFSAATLIEEDPKNQVVEGDEIRRG